MIVVTGLGPCVWSLEKVKEERGEGGFSGVLSSRRLGNGLTIEFARLIAENAGERWLLQRKIRLMAERDLAHKPMQFTPILVRVCAKPKPLLFLLSTKP